MLEFRRDECKRLTEVTILRTVNRGRSRRVIIPVQTRSRLIDVAEARLEKIRGSPTFPYGPTSNDYPSGVGYWQECKASVNGNH